MAEPRANSWSPPSSSSWAVPRAGAAARLARHRRGLRYLAALRGARQGLADRALRLGGSPGRGCRFPLAGGAGASRCAASPVGVALGPADMVVGRYAVWPRCGALVGTWLNELARDVPASDRLPLRVLLARATCRSLMRVVGRSAAAERVSGHLAGCAVGGRGTCAAGGAGRGRTRTGAAGGGDADCWPVLAKPPAR